MGISIRSFFVDNDDKITSVPTAKIDRLFKKDPNETFPEFSNFKVLLVQAYVELENRKPVRILTIEGSILPFESKGILDQDELWKEMQTGVNATIQLDFPGGNEKVINATHRFAAKTYHDKYTWIPSEEVKNKVIMTIFKDK